MKAYYVSFIFIFFVCCVGFNRTNKQVGNDDSIIYILPFKVSKELKSFIDSSNFDIFLCIHQYSGGWEIFPCIENPGNKNPFLEKTNRKAFIMGKFYPVILESDNLFATTTSADKVLLEYESKRTTTLYSHYIAHDGYSIKFDNQGKINIAK